MLGLMQNQPLLISSLIDFAERHHGDTEIVSRRVEGDLHRYTWRDVARRARQAAHALDGMNRMPWTVGGRGGRVSPWHSGRRRSGGAPSSTRPM